MTKEFIPVGAEQITALMLLASTITVAGDRMPEGWVGGLLASTITVAGDRMPEGWVGGVLDAAGAAYPGLPVGRQQHIRRRSMTIYAETVADVLDQRIADLAHDAAWYKRQRDWRRWRDLRIEADVELRALRNMRRRAVRLAEARPDPITEAKRYDDWAESELAGAWGR